MKKTGIHSKFQVWLIGLSTIALLIGLIGILYHLSHHHGDLDNCEICLLGSSLFVTAIVLAVFLSEFIGLLYIPAQDSVISTVRTFHIIRAPPVILLRINQ